MPPGRPSTSPSFSANSAMKSSGRLPSADWTTLAPPEPSRAPSCSVAVPTRRASRASAAAATTNVSTAPSPAKWQSAASADRGSGHGELDPVAPRHRRGTYQALSLDLRGRARRPSVPKPERKPSFSGEEPFVAARLTRPHSSLAASALASTANASDLIDRNAHGVTLSVNAKGEALITLHGGRQAQARARVGRDERDRADARARRRCRSSSTTRAAGASTSATTGRRSTTRARPTPGPALAWKVTACTAPDGSYWALQAWQRMLPNYGVAPTGMQGAWELRLSHWTGELPALQIDTDWAWHQWDHLFGTFTYDERSRCTASARRRRACRSTRSAGTSTSTRSTRRTARAGSARTAS